MHLAQQSLKIAASASQGGDSIPGLGVLSSQPCTHSKAFAAKALLSGPSPCHKRWRIYWQHPLAPAALFTFLDDRAVLAERPGVGRAWCWSSLSPRSLPNVCKVSNSTLALFTHGNCRSVISGVRVLGWQMRAVCHRSAPELTCSLQHPRTRGQRTPRAELPPDRAQFHTATLPGPGGGERAGYRRDAGRIRVGCGEGPGGMSVAARAEGAPARPPPERPLATACSVPPACLATAPRPAS